MCATTWYRGHDYDAVSWRRSWETELGGPTMIHGIHAMDLLLWLMGYWQQISAMIATLDRQIDVEDISMALVQFENQAMVSMINSVLSPRDETYLCLDF